MTLHVTGNYRETRKAITNLKGLEDALDQRRKIGLVKYNQVEACKMSWLFIAVMVSATP